MPETVPDNQEHRSIPEEPTDETAARLEAERLQAIGRAELARLEQITCSRLEALAVATHDTERVTRVRALFRTPGVPYGALVALSQAVEIEFSAAFPTTPQARARPLPDEPHDADHPPGPRWEPERYQVR